jgi:hypothetical protein
MTSHTTATASPPFDLISSTSSSSKFARRAVATTAAPSSAKRTAQARPIPELAPVTIAARPSRIPMAETTSSIID